MGNVTITVPTGEVKISPHLSQITARNFLAALPDASSQGKFSPVPFFLCCRAIELSLKARHLEEKSAKDVKHLYRHNLQKLYDDLESSQQTLATSERDLLIAANGIYDTKGFEYLSVYDAVTAYKRFPNLNELRALAIKLTSFEPK